MTRREANKPGKNCATRLPLVAITIVIIVSATHLLAAAPAGSPETAAAGVQPVSDDSTDSVNDAGRGRALMASLTIFVLAIFVGFEIITKVPPTLHTPLMSGSNAISGIALVGAVIVTGQVGGMPWLGMLAVAFATINVVGGFLVTHRMLAMFARPRSATSKDN